MILLKQGAATLNGVSDPNRLDVHFTNPEPMAFGPDDELCEPGTRGCLTPQPVRIAGLRVSGQETHRRRDEEAVQGWDVQLDQEVFARFCRAPGCPVALERRQRSWCEKHRKYPGTRRAAWNDLHWL